MKRHHHPLVQIQTSSSCIINYSIYSRERMSDPPFRSAPIGTYNQVSVVPVYAPMDIAATITTSAAALLIIRSRNCRALFKYGFQLDYLHGESKLYITRKSHIVFCRECTTII